MADAAARRKQRIAAGGANRMNAILASTGSAKHSIPVVLQTPATSTDSATPFTHMVPASALANTGFDDHQRSSPSSSSSSSQKQETEPQSATNVNTSQEAINNTSNTTTTPTPTPTPTKTTTDDQTQKQTPTQISHPTTPAPTPTNPLLMGNTVRTEPPTIDKKKKKTNQSNNIPRIIHWIVLITSILLSVCVYFPQHVFVGDYAQYSPSITLFDNNVLLALMTEFIVSGIIVLQYSINEDDSFWMRAVKSLRVLVILEIIFAFGFLFTYQLGTYIVR